MTEKKQIKEELEKVKKEKEQIAQQLQTLENQRNQLITRLIELQGIEKFLEEKLKTENK